RRRAGAADGGLRRLPLSGQLAVALARDRPRERHRQVGAVRACGAGRLDVRRRPVASLEIDYVAGNTVDSRVVTNSSGMYAVDLRPGTYEVKLVTYMRVISGPTKLTLGAGTRTVANYMLDNGIRVPVPAQ